jgi:hypothetical protein
VLFFGGGWIGLRSPMLAVVGEADYIRYGRNIKAPPELKISPEGLRCS